MLKRRSTWLGGTGALVLVLSLSGMVAGATPPDAQPVVAVDTTATFEDIDGNGIDDDCQLVAAIENPDAVTTETLTVDTNADGVISTTEAAHSARIGGKNCNHGGYVSWIAHQSGDCATEPTEAETTEPADNEVTEPGDVEAATLVVTTPPDAEPDADPCEPPADETSDGDSASADHAAISAAHLAAKTERKLAHEAKKAERQAAHAARQAERQAAKAAKQAERHAAKAAKAKHKSH
jgi:hypothetical protein